MPKLDLQGFFSLGADINKKKDQDQLETQEGVVSDKLPELKLNMSDENILKLTQKWEKAWNTSAKKTKWITQITENEKYWLGEQFKGSVPEGRRAQIDNIIFESLETYLPQTTRRNPEPLIALRSEEKDVEGPTDGQTKYVQKVKDRLADLADENKLRLKLKQVVRNWAIYQLGVCKYGWDLDRDIPIMRVIRPKKLILDPDATINEDGYNGDRIGHYRKMRADTMIGIIGQQNPSAITAIKALTEKELGTEIQFIEWWTPEFMVWTLDKLVLLKRKNPHWNYDTDEVEESVDDFGNTTKSDKLEEGINHFATPKMPFSFLSVFNLGDQPMDKTSLIQQNLANQDLINKRNKQIDKNADKMNGGAVVSLERSGLTEPQAHKVSKAVRDGGTILVPTGSAQEAVYFPTVPSLPGDVYNQLLDTRSRTRDIFGTSGSTPAGIKDEKTVRGKILTKNLDTDRIGGGISEFLEQYADDVYNWFVQLLYVYSEDFQFLDGGKPPKLLVSIIEGSLLPKDSLSIANQALELANMGKLSNLDLYKRLEYPNPEELAANVWLETNAPQLLYKDNQDVQQAMGLIEQQEEQAAVEEQLPTNPQV